MPDADSKSETIWDKVIYFSKIAGAVLLIITAGSFAYDQVATYFEKQVTDKQQAEKNAAMYEYFEAQSKLVEINAKFKKDTEARLKELEKKHKENK